MSRIFIIAAAAAFLAAPVSAQTNAMSSNTMSSNTMSSNSMGGGMQGATHNTKNCVKAASTNSMSGGSMSGGAMSSNTMGAHPAAKPCPKPNAMAPNTMGGAH